MNSRSTSKVIHLPVHQEGKLKGVIFEDGTNTNKTVKPSQNSGFMPFGLIVMLLFSIAGLLFYQAIKPGLTSYQLRELEQTKSELSRLKECLR